ncbi:MAG: PEP-CTERM sorting domain-containing protein, partial [Planctomycetota bacterium]|nr:PEP-CTERM sorting domain-containing protein [Planctomycetota bacterium]
DVTNANQPILVRASNSGEQNTENLWSNLIGGHRYRLQVNGTADQGQFDSDYGLAWSTTGTIGWTGSSGNAWQNSGQANFVRGQSGSVYDDYEHVVFNDHADASRTNISVQGSPTPASILVDNSTRDYSFNDGPIGQTPAGLIKRGTGTLTLNSHNLHIGKNHIESGTVVVTADQALGSTAAQTIVSSGAALAFRSVNYTAAEPVSVSGNGPTGRGAIENQAGNSSFAGPVTVTSSSGIGVTGGSLAITGNLSVDASQTATKLGSGTLAMRGGHTLSHNSRLFVQAGSVILAPEASSPVSIAAQGAALQIGNAGAVVIDASRRDPLSDSSVRTQRVSVINDSATGLTVSAGMTAANEITGRGNTFVSAGASLQADRIEQNALLIGSAAKVELRNSSAGGTASLVQSLVIDGGSRPTGLLDLANNDLVISATNATKNTVLSTTVQQILFSQNKTGAHSHWDRAGISTSTAAAINSSAGGELLGLAAIRNSDFLTVGMSAEDSFSGLPVDSDDILVKYTFLGDANLDGLIDMDDYGLIDAIMRGIRPNLGWISGDFNYDGSVDFDDYGLIDFAFGMQNAILLEESVGAVSLSAPATTHQAATLASFLNSDATLVVPEPETWLLLGIGCVTIGIAALARRRRVSSQ